MKRLTFVFIALLLLTSHDMFLKFDSFILEPNKPASLHLYNGTFDRSDNIITRDRMLDVSIVGNDQRTVHPDSMWMDVGSTTVLNFLSGDLGTYVAGVSTAARSLEMSAEDFNGYLEHDGVLDVLEQRKKDGKEGESANEKYSKHVKVIFQVGDRKTNDWNTNLGYPIEFIPQSNPYDLKINENIIFQLLRGGKPLSNQLVYLGTESDGHSHDSDESHTHDEVQLRTDDSGLVEVLISSNGKWYLRTIHLVESEEEGLTHESNWASITFEIDDGSREIHSHSHNHSHGLPWYGWAVGAILLLSMIYLLMNRK